MTNRALRNLYYYSKKDRKPQSGTSERAVYDRLKLRFYCMLAGIHDPLTAQFLRERYLGGRSWVQISVNRGLTPDAVRKKCRRATSAAHSRMTSAPEHRAEKTGPEKAGKHGNKSRAEYKSAV